MVVVCSFRPSFFGWRDRDRVNGAIDLRGKGQGGPLRGALRTSKWRQVSGDSKGNFLPYSIFNRLQSRVPGDPQIGGLYRRLRSIYKLLFKEANIYIAFNFYAADLCEYPSTPNETLQIVPCPSFAVVSVAAQSECPERAPLPVRSHCRGNLP